MFPASAARVLERVPDDALVLDVGGWGRPFPRPTGCSTRCPTPPAASTASTATDRSGSAPGRGCSATSATGSRGRFGTTRSTSLSARTRWRTCATRCGSAASSPGWPGPATWRCVPAAGAVVRRARAVGRVEPPPLAGRRRPEAGTDHLHLQAASAPRPTGGTVPGRLRRDAHRRRAGVDAVVAGWLRGDRAGRDRAGRHRRLPRRRR